MQFGVNKHEYQKTRKLHEPVGQVQFVVWKIYKYLLHQIAGGNHVITCYNAHEKNIAEGQDRRSFKSVRELFVFCPRVTTMHLHYEFAFALHENALVFSQSEARNFFMYLINKVIYL